MRSLLFAFALSLVASCAASQPAGPVTTASGLVYQSLKDGSGTAPTATDTVKVHYRGTLPDGREFDSSYKRGEPAEFGLNRVIRAGYALLHLVTYFTVGPKEARAWTIEQGTKAPQAAGVIHTDFEKGFIRAETVAYADYVAHNGEAGAREAGKFRLEGKEYVVQDGDCLHFRFAN